MTIDTDEDPSAVAPAEFCFILSDKLPLPNLLKVLKNVHDSQPAYDVCSANCVWYVKRVVGELEEEKLFSEQARPQLQKMKSDKRMIISTPPSGLGITRSVGALSKKVRS